MVLASLIKEKLRWTLAGIHNQILAASSVKEYSQQKLKLSKQANISVSFSMLLSSFAQILCDITHIIQASKVAAHSSAPMPDPTMVRNSYF